jgi:hypothetical protein
MHDLLCETQSYMCIHLTSPFNVAGYEVLTALIMNGTVLQNYTPQPSQLRRPRTPYSSHASHILTLLSLQAEQLLPLLKTKYPETMETMETIDDEAYRFVLIIPTLKTAAISSHEFRYYLCQELFCHLASLTRNFIQGHFRICKRKNCGHSVIHLMGWRQRSLYWSEKAA